MTRGRFHKINKNKTKKQYFHVVVLDGALLENENSVLIHGNYKTICDGNSHLDNRHTDNENNQTF